MELFKSFKKFDDKDNIFSGLGNKLKPVVFRSIELTPETIASKILDPHNKLSEEDIKSLIIFHYNTILNYDLFLSDKNMRKIAQKLFSDKTFLKILLSEIGLLSLNEHQIICLNKLCYDYYLVKNKDSETFNIFMSITYEVNKDLIIKLLPIIGVDAARIIAMISRSSFKEYINIHRVNTFLITSGIEMSIRDMISLYLKLYDRFTNVFVYTMMEKMDYCSELQKRMDNNISSAMLNILLSLTSADMRTVLLHYGFTLKMQCTGPAFLRFALRDVNDVRLKTVIESIDMENYNYITII